MHTSPIPHWHTSSFGSSATTTGRDLLALGAHAKHCRALRGHFHVLQSSAQSIQGLVTARVVTTLLVLTLLTALLSLMA
jgi:hypothetical protein